ncbi:MAG: BREX-6 system adenine-specific DNA-methyltransferase PglX [Elainella sp.]
MSNLTPEAKAKLSSTIRGLRDRLLTDIHNAVESTYRLSLPIAKAGLAEEQQVKRQRLEQWLGEQVRSEAKRKNPDGNAIRNRHLQTAEKLAAATLLNRLVVIKQMEAIGAIKPMIVTGGWQSNGYREFRDFAPDLCRDETEGFGTLLQLLYDELSLEMPGLFGRVRLSSLFPIPASTLRAVIEALNDPALQDAWLDDTTLGWVYQYWNDPEREALDVKLNAGGKVEPHEIASKTQMFTERYMVEWLLHNSLGQIWLAICQAQGWMAEVRAEGTLDRLESRRKVWREKRERGEVALDALMPIETEAEERWKYWVPQPLTDAAIDHAPLSIRAVKILDPACGSGHFLVIAFGLLFALYQEEARHRGEEWSDREIVESILANNLYGVDLDARAVQIAAAALLLKAKTLCREAEIKQVNLVASDLNLTALPEDDPALAELRREVREATGIPEELTNQIVQALQGADQWGSLLKIDREVEKAIAQYEQRLVRPVQGELFDPHPLAPSPQGEEEPSQSILSSTSGRGVGGEGRTAILLEKLETFLSRRTRGDDLGLRLRGEQLTAGVRFIRMIRENAYDVVVGNPPYQGASKMSDAKYLIKHYPKSKADLYATFLERGLQLAKEGGISALLTMRNWMFIQQYTPIREYLLDTFDLRLLGDVDRGAFEETLDEVVATVMSVFQKFPSSEEISIALQPTPLDDNSRDRYRTNRKRSAVLTQVGRFEFKSDRFKVIKKQPLVYWWHRREMLEYEDLPKLETYAPLRGGMGTGDNTRFLRKPWEVDLASTYMEVISSNNYPKNSFSWFPYIKGAGGRAWIEGVDDLVSWNSYGLGVKAYNQMLYGSYSRTIKNESWYCIRGVAFSMIGNAFSGRVHKYCSIIGNKGSSVFPKSLERVVCLLNCRKSKNILASLNPGIGFEIGDVNRLPLFPIESADEIFAQLDCAFTEHESARETSVEFKQPGASCWNYAQQWAQQAVDRELGTALPDWNPVYDQPPAVNWVSYAIGVALGRFTSPPSPLSTCGEGGQEGGADWGQEGGGAGELDRMSSASLHSMEKGRGDEVDRLLRAEIPGYIYQRCRELRGSQTPTEERLWEVLRNRQLNGLKFRRQHPLGRYIADFYCAEKQLVIELDGSVHQQADQQDYDKIRDESLQSRRLSILRISNTEIEQNLETVLQKILIFTPSPPVEKGQGGEVLPNGILYLSAYSGDRPDSKDSLNHAAAQPIKKAWEEHGSPIAKNKSLRDWLRLSFFKDLHVGMYEQRPIYFPLSSKNRSFVAYISIHRWADNTLQTLLADYLIPELRGLEGETADLLGSKGRGDRKQQAQAEERHAAVQALYTELQAFIDLVQQCAEQGPPAASPKDSLRQANAPFRMDLDDGVMVNSAALWCLLEPQWNKPKTWWSELCNAKGKKDYDWSHLAARYFPDRVDAKCQKDPSLAVAHGCFWQYHPAKAYEWELRLQDEIAPEFTIDEANSDTLRQQFEAENPELVADLREKEEKRRERKRKKSHEAEELSLFQTESEEEDE